MNGREGIGMWIDTAIVLGYILLLVGIGLAILFAKSHGSQPEGADFK